MEGDFLELNDLVENPGEEIAIERPQELQMDLNLLAQE